MSGTKLIHDRYFADGFLLEASRTLSCATEASPSGRGIYDADRVTIFTALAAEAHINHAIETGLSGAALEAANELRILKKLQLVPELAGSDMRPDPGQLPFQDLASLFARRNKLVHAKPPVCEVNNWGTSSGSIKVPAYGHDLADSARWFSSLCRYLVELSACGVEAWREHDYLASRLLEQDKALRDWNPNRDGRALAELVDYLVYTDLDETNTEPRH